MICGVSMTVLVLPVTPIALRQIPGYENPNLAVPGMADYLSQNWQAYLGGYAFDSQLLFGAATRWLWATLAMMIGGLILAWRARQTVHLAFLLTWLVGGLALYYVAVIDRGTFNVPTAVSSRLRSTPCSASLWQGWAGSGNRCQLSGCC